MTNPDIIKIPDSFIPEVNIKPDTNGAKLATDPPQANSSTMAVMVHTVSIPQKLEALTALVRERLKPGLDQSLQEELAVLLNLIPELNTSYNERFIPLVEIAVVSLLSETPNLTLAKGIREDIVDRVHRSPLLTILRGGGPPPTRLILGLGTLLYFVIPAFVIFLPSALAKIDIFSLPLFLLVAIAGAIGSVVSILVRLQDSELLKNIDPTMLFLTGLLKPIIGTTFALFVFATLSSGLVPLTVDPVKAPFFFTALAFVSGFSERFAKDILTRTEGTIVAVQSAKL